MTENESQEKKLKIEDTIELINITEEKRLRDKWKANSRKACDTEIKKYAECMKNHRILVYKCKPLFREMNECLHQHSTEENLEQLRKEFRKEKLKKLQENNGAD